MMKKDKTFLAGRGRTKVRGAHQGRLNTRSAITSKLMSTFTTDEAKDFILSGALLKHDTDITPFLNKAGIEETGISVRKVERERRLVFVVRSHISTQPGEAGLYRRLEDLFLQLSVNFRNVIRVKRTCHQRTIRIVFQPDAEDWNRVVAEQAAEVEAMNREVEAMNREVQASLNRIAQARAKALRPLRSARGGRLCLNTDLTPLLAPLGINALSRCRYSGAKIRPAIELPYRLSSSDLNELRAVLTANFKNIRSVKQGRSCVRILFHCDARERNVFERECKRLKAARVINNK